MSCPVFKIVIGKSLIAQCHVGDQFSWNVRGGYGIVSLQAQGASF